MICVVAGERGDCALLVEMLDGKKVEGCSCGVELYSALCNGQEVVIVATGYGKVNSGAGVATILCKYPVTCMIGVGNCGSHEYFCANRNVVGVSCNGIQFDVDYTKIGYKKFQVPRIKPHVFDCDEHLVSLACQCSRKYRFRSCVGLFGSADQFIANTEQAVLLDQQYNVAFLDNETGVWGQIAYLYGIPYVSVKGVSNDACDEAGSLYKEYEKQANQNACKVVCSMIGTITRNNWYC